MKQLTMDAAARAVGLCEWCGMLHTQTCSGRLSYGTPPAICGKKICRAHAKMVSRKVMRHFRNLWVHRYLCPDCVDRNRSAF